LKRRMSSRGFSDTARTALTFSLARSWGSSGDGRFALVDYIGAGLADLWPLVLRNNPRINPQATLAMPAGLTPRKREITKKIIRAK